MGFGKLVKKIAPTVLGMFGGSGQARKAYHRQKKLMALQRDHQMQLNEHGNELSMDLWNQTNYGAQVEHMKKAGLNPALMYGTPGQGGTTGGTSGGSAASGQAPQERIMDMSSMMQQAQIDNLKSAEDLNRAKAKLDDAKTLEVLGETDEKKEFINNLRLAGKNLEVTFDNIIANTKESGKRTEILEIEKRMKGITETYQIDQLDKALELQSAQIRQLIAKAYLDEEQVGGIVSNLTADYWLKQSQNQLNQAKINLTGAQEQNIVEGTNKIINDMKIDWANIDIAKKTLLINDYKAKLQLTLKEMDIDFATKKLITDTSAQIFGDLLNGLTSVKVKSMPSKVVKGN